MPWKEVVRVGRDAIIVSEQVRKGPLAKLNSPLAPAFGYSCEAMRVSFSGRIGQPGRSSPSSSRAS